jgi:hypothetical protein
MFEQELIPWDSPRTALRVPLAARRGVTAVSRREAIWAADGVVVAEVVVNRSARRTSSYRAAISPAPSSS